MKYLQAIKETISNFFIDEVVTRSAALSFYAVFSLPAGIIIILSIISFQLDQDTAQNYFINFTKNLTNDETAQIIKEILPNIISQAPQKIESTISIILLIISSSALFSNLIQTINHIIGVPEKFEHRKIMDFVIARIFSLLAILFIVFLTFLSFLSDTVLSILKNFLRESAPYILPTIHIINLTIGALLIVTLFTFIFKLLPLQKIKWKEALLSALITTILFSLGRSFLILGLGNFADFSTFGAANTLIVLLIWIYYSANVTLFGAEIVKTLVKQRQK